MPAACPEAAVAFITREKFAWALASLKRLYALGGAPFTLYLVDGVYPPAVRAGLEVFLSDKPNVVRIDAGRFLYPGEALNLVIERLAEPWLLLVQNDVLIGRNALASMLETARILGCDAVIPRVLDTDTGSPAAHRDSDTPRILLEKNGQVYFKPTANPELRAGCPRVDIFEVHCLLLSAAAARAVSPLPPLSVHDHIDLSIAFWRHGMTAFMDERIRVLYMDSPPLPLRDIECPFYRFRWDAVHARQSDAYVRSKWRIPGLFDAKSFIARQQTALQPEAILTRYDSIFELDPWPDEIPAA